MVKNENEDSGFIKKAVEIFIIVGTEKDEDKVVTLKIEELSTEISVDEEIIGTIDTQFIYEFERVLKETLDFIG